MSQNLVAIEISQTRARYCVLQTTLRKAELVKLGEVEYTADTSRQEILAAIQAELPDTLDSVVLNFDASQCSLRAITFPFSDIRKVEAALAFELDGQIPHDLDAMTMAWHVTHRSDEGTEVIAAAA